MKKTMIMKVSILALALVFCFSMLFTSCGEEEGTTDTTVPVTTPTTNPSTAPTSGESITDSSTGVTDPSSGTTDPSSGTTDPSSGTTDPSSGTTDPSSGTTDSSNPGTTDEPCTEHTGGTATCTKKAVCENCGVEYGELAAHTEEIVPAKAPTCVEKGLTEGKKCSVCEAILVEQTEVDMIDHVYDEEIRVVSPTCSAGGYTVYGCSSGECGRTEERDETDPIGEHSYIASSGLEEYDVICCEYCGATYVNITTGVTKIYQGFCLGDCGAADAVPCTCGAAEQSACTCGSKPAVPCSCPTITEWNGFSKPIAPEAIVAGTPYTRTQITELQNVEFQLGGGLIKLVSESEANYKITVGNEVIEVSGADIYVSLAEYDSVTSVTIESDADATVVLYKPLA